MLTSASPVTPGSCFGDALWFGSYTIIFPSPSSAYENGSNLDSKLQGDELRGHMKGAEGRSKQRK